MAQFKNISDEDIAQIRNIIGDNYLKAIDVLHDCASMVGACSPEECESVTGTPKRTIQYQVKKENRVFVKIGNSKFPCINI
jgi:Fe-S cluster biogenesis protein NfuA